MILQALERIESRDYFECIDLSGERAFIDQAIAVEREARIGEHAFFTKAAEDPAALKLWVSQEAIVTNPFSQILFATLAQIKNVHIRALLLPVVTGEHGPLRGAAAEKSHPWLIWRLCQSLGIAEQTLGPTRAVLNFIGVLEANCVNPMRALGTLGIGNELMLLSEYRAIETCFDRLCPDAEYRGFLHGNIDEDEIHTKLIDDAAVALGNLGYDRLDFVEGARSGVAARVAYYNSLLEECGQHTSRP